jgi:hypothetical protein
MPPPNTAFQPTPLRGPKIGGILQADVVLTRVPTYQGGAAERWPLGRTLPHPRDVILLSKL